MADKLTKFTEEELKHRKIGTFIDKDFSPENAVIWKVKRETYEGEGVYRSYSSLYKSFSVLLLDAENSSHPEYYDRRTATKCSQLMIDTYLLKGSRGEKSEIPNQVYLYEIKKESEIKDGIELYDAELFDDKGGVTENEMIRWVHKNMLIADIQPEDAPCSDAYGMLLHYRKSEQRQEKFYDTMVPKLLSKEDAAKTGKLEDDGKDQSDLIKRLQAALPESE
jgi:hypothetical protein